MSGYAWLGQAESDLHESAAIQRHARLRARPALARAMHGGWLTPAEVREMLDRPSLGTTPGPAAPPTPASSLPGESVCAAPEAGVDTRRGDGAGPDPVPGPEVGEAGHTAADPRPIPFRAISRIMRLAWGRK